MEQGFIKPPVEVRYREELEALKAVFARQGRERWNGGAQLTYPGTGKAEKVEDGAFLV